MASTPSFPDSTNPETRYWEDRARPVVGHRQGEPDRPDCNDCASHLACVPVVGELCQLREGVGSGLDSERR